jgi:RNA polymerase sigma factor (sigma-70 family)
MSVILATAPSPPITRRRPWSHTDGDLELLLAVRRGDAEAAGELYRRYHRDLRRFVAARFRGTNADDIVSEAFARTLRAIRNGAGPHDHALRYLFVAARTVAIANGTRDRRRDDAERRFAMDVASAATSTDDAFGGAVHVAFEGLSDRQQTVLWLTEVEGRTAVDAGGSLGIGAEAVHSLAYRSRQALRIAFLAALEHVSERSAHEGPPEGQR